MDKQVTIQDLQKKLAAQSAELIRVSDELTRVKIELAREVTERGQTEEILRESEERFRFLVEQTHDVVYAVAPDGIVNYISPQSAHFGYSPEEIISKHFIEFVAPEQRPRVLEAFGRGTRDGTNTPTVFQWLRKDGSRIWVEVVGNNVLDDAGVPVQQIGVIRDVTARIQQEETTRSLMLLLETLDAECFIKDKDGIYQYINKAFERQFSVNRENAIGKGDAYVFGEETAAFLRENDLRIMASGETESLEESTTLKDGGYVVYVTIKTPITDANGQVSGICGVGINITRQKQIETKRPPAKAGGFGKRATESGCSG